LGTKIVIAADKQRYDSIIDDFCKENKIQNIDLLKIDVEGYELNALLGTVETIKKYKPVLCIEFCEKWLNRYKTSSDEILGLLKELNYIHAEDYGVDKIFTYNES
jgi:hypothetical protein